MNRPVTPFALSLWKGLTVVEEKGRASTSSARTVLEGGL